MTHKCVSKLIIIVSDNGLSHGDKPLSELTMNGLLNQCWNIVNPNLRSNFSEIVSEIHIFSFRKMHLKMSAAKWPFCPGLNVSTICHVFTAYIQMLGLIVRYISHLTYFQSEKLCIFSLSHNMPWNRITSFALLFCLVSHAYMIWNHWNCLSKRFDNFNIWDLWCQNQVFQEGIPQYSVGCNCVFLPEIPASGVKVIIW